MSENEAKKAGSSHDPAEIKHGFWRGNLEAFTVAIVMALVIKQFAFEAFQVPTESMEPTIIGRKSSGDRIIVDKASYMVRDPERWEVVVFRYPLSGLVNYVKRCVGLPSEAIKIVQGDIYTAPDHGTDLKVARKPHDLQETIFHENAVIPEERTEDFEVGTLLDFWQLDDANRQVKDGHVVLDAGKAEKVVFSRDKITIERHDEHAKDRTSTQDRTDPRPTGDLRIETTVTPEAGTGAVVLGIKDCTQPHLPLRLELAVEGGAERTTLRHGKTEIADEALAALKLPAGEESEIWFENVDDAIRVGVDGEQVFEHLYVQAVERVTVGRSQVSFGLTSGKADFSRLALFRDLHYTVYPDTTDAPFHVPEGHYLFFGDNSPNSLDARGWRVVGIRLRADGRILLGDMEAVSDELAAQRQSSNPWLEPDDERHHFFDIRGNHWRLEPGSYDVLDLRKFPNEQDVGVMKLHATKLPSPEPGQLAYEAVSTARLRELLHLSNDRSPFIPNSHLMHYVPRRDIVGRAFFVFWPLTRLGVIR